MVMGSIKIGTEVLVIGGGPGGYVAAERAAQFGKDVVLVEWEELGGTCLNHGCIPSKALISVGDLVSKVKEAGERGVTVHGSLEIDFAKTQEWKQNKVIKRLTQGVAALMKAGQIEVVRGKAKFLDAHTVEIALNEGGNAVYTFKHCIIATGSRAVNPKFFPIDHQNVVSARDALAFTEIPKKFVVVGGGYIGVELGIAYAKLGSQVTIVEAADQLLSGTDPDILAVLMRKLRRLGVTVMLNARAGGGLQDGKVKVEEADGKVTLLEADKVLVAIGRRPYTEGLELENAGLAIDEMGFIHVDDQMRTAVKHIYAIGDVVSPVMLAHKASAQGRVAAEAIAGKPSYSDWKTVPAVIFTDPEIATVGLTEKQAKDQGIDVVVSKHPFTAIGRALTMAETDGLVKLVANRQTGVLLGAQLAGPEVSELIGEITHAIEMGALVEDVALTPHYHPTLSEGILEAAHKLLHELEGAKNKVAANVM
ncbi:MAG TPA: dihydrolipoyl dehydrogenase [Symbiobacteriaceae bacterium]|nr:dihydrolipoyl dehydrogenase [Symbiobacteriaceae bacterium]